MTRIFTFSHKEVVDEILRDMAQQWRVKKQKMQAAGIDPKTVLIPGREEEIHERNLQQLDQEEQRIALGIDDIPGQYTITSTAVTKLKDYLKVFHCLIGGLAADEYHLWRHGVLPQMPALLSSLTKDLPSYEVAGLVEATLGYYRSLVGQLEQAGDTRIPDLLIDVALGLVPLFDPVWAQETMEASIAQWLKQRNLEPGADPLLAVAQDLTVLDCEYVEKLNRCLQLLGIDRQLHVENACFERGMQRSNAGEYTPAISDFDQVIQLNADSVRGHYQRGLALLQLKQSEQAIPDFSRTLALQADHAEAFRYRADAHDQLGNRAQGVNDLRTAVQHYVQAVQDYDRAIALGINTVIEKRGFVADKIDGIRQQAERAKRELEARQKRANDAFQNGMGALAQKDFEGAIGCFEQALQLGHSEAATQLAEAQRLAKMLALVVDLGNGVTLELVEVAAGEFDMGEPGSSQRVSVEAFQIGKYPVTQEQYQAVMGTNPSHFQGKPDSAKRPVEKVSWHDAVTFCEKLSAMTGRRFRLLKEREWEYACRAESNKQYCYGDGDSQLKQYAWYDANSGNETHAVGAKLPNAWDIYDMHGNIWEWCDDVIGSSKVLRGGSWLNGSDNCRSASRYSVSAGKRDNNYGFRVACSSAWT